MSVGRFLQQAAAGVGGAVYETVEDLFATNIYEGTGSYFPIENGLNIGAGLRGGTASYFHGRSMWHNTSDNNTAWGGTGKQLTLSLYVRKEIRTTERFFSWGDAEFIQLENDRIVFNVRNSSGTTIINKMWNAPNGTFSDNQWHHILASFDTDGAIGYCYVDGVAASFFAGGVTSGQYIRDIQNIRIGGSATRPDPNDTTSLRGSLAHVFLDNVYRDITQQSVRDLFSNADNTPKDLSGLNPLYYYPLGSSGGENLGTLSDAIKMAEDTNLEGGEIITVFGPDNYVNGKGGLVITKSRTGTAYDTQWFDTERGVLNRLRGASSDAQSSLANSLTHFTPNGHAVYAGADVNNNASTFCSWSFRKAQGFFDIVTYTGNGSTQSISHNLGSTPGFILIKGYDTNSQDWIGWHPSLDSFGAGSWIRFNSTESVSNTSRNNVFGDNTQPVSPTDSAFTVGNYSHVNSNGVNYVAYVFANDATMFGPDADQSVIKCGSYTGTASEQQIDLGWEPQWLLVKDISRTLDNWIVVDTQRGIHRDSNDEFLALNRPELINNHLFGDFFSVNSEGFTVKGSDDAVNRGGDIYIYVAIRRPHKPATDIEKGLLYTFDFGKANSEFDNGGERYNAPHRVDLGTDFTQYGSYSKRWATRKTGLDYQQSSTSAAEAAGAGYTWDNDTGWANNSASADSKFSHMWARAPGYCDVVTYVGNGSNNHAIPHGLGVAPELIILKGRNTAVGWPVWCSHDPNHYFYLNSAGDGQSNNRIGTVTDTTFEVMGNNQDTNRTNDEFLALLFASVEGKSKVGVYTGNGSASGPTVSCGFDEAPRFIMIRRGETTGSSWHVWSKRMGLYVGSGDWQSTLESTAANTTGNDNLDPTSDGFQLTTTSTAYNANGAKYIYLAFA